MSAKFWLMMLLPTLVSVPIAGRRSRAAAKAQQQQARPDCVGIGDAELRTQIADAGGEAGSGKDRDPGCADTRFVQYVGAKGVGPGSDSIVERNMGVGLPRISSELVAGSFWYACE